MICDICGENESIGVYASRLAPYSYAQCKTCIDNFAESTSLVDIAIKNDFEFMNPLLSVDNITTFYKGKYIPIREYKELTTEQNKSIVI